MNQYPEHDHLAQISEKSQAIGEFLDWLQNQKKLTLCTYVRPGKVDDIWTPTDANIHKLLAEYFGIDENRLEEEKRAMLKNYNEAVDQAEGLHKRAVRALLGDDAAKLEGAKTKS